MVTSLVDLTLSKRYSMIVVVLRFLLSLRDHSGQIKLRFDGIFLIKLMNKINRQVIGRTLVHGMGLMCRSAFISWHIIIVGVYTLGKFSSVCILRRCRTRLVILYYLWLEKFLKHFSFLFIFLLFEQFHLSFMILLIIVETGKSFFFPRFGNFPGQSGINLRIYKFILIFLLLLNHHGHFLLSPMLFRH